MIVNDLNNQVGTTRFSKVITIDDDGDDTTYVFPNTAHFIQGINHKRNAEKLHKILKHGNYL